MLAISTRDRIYPRRLVMIVVCMYNITEYCAEDRTRYMEAKQSRVWMLILFYT